MERQISYIGQIPMDTDILNTNLNSYVGQAKLAAGVLGTSTQLNGLACTQNGTPNMTVNVAAGEIYQLAAIDTVAYGSLPPNSTQILKQGINLLTTNVSGFAAPSSVGFSVNYLVEFTLTQLDNGSVVLPYYDSANPSQAFSGPNNNSQPNNTNRANIVGIQIVAGTAATTGTQTTPSPDSGYVGGWVVTIAHGQTTIINSNIALYPSAPFITSIVNFASQSAIQRGQYIYALDTSGSPNTITASLSPALTAYTTGMTVFIKLANTNTGASTININALGSKNIKYENGTALIGGEMTSGGIHAFSYDGTNFQLINPVFLLSTIQTGIQNSTYNSATDTGSANAYLVSLSPAVASYVAGLRFTMKVVNSNTGASTVNVNSLGTKNIKLMNGSDPHAAALLAGAEADLFYDGTNFQILNPARMATQVGVQNATYIFSADTGAANAYVVTLAPVPTAYTTGMTILMKVANTNTTASTVNVNSLGAKSIKLQNGNDPNAGDLLLNQIVQIEYDGTNFQLLNPAGYYSMFQSVAVQTFANGGSGTYTPNAKMVYAVIEAVGAGGGGGGCAQSTVVGSGGGGGSGGYSRVTVTKATVGASQAVTVPAGGNGGTAGANNGTAGTATSVGTLCVANGGSPGGGAAANSRGQGGAGGTAGTGDIAATGNGGGAGNGNATAATISADAGRGGGSFWGGTGAGFSANTGSGGAAGVNGGNYGAGGGGGSSANNSVSVAGGNGGPGFVIITEYLNT